MTNKQHIMSTIVVAIFGCFFIASSTSQHSQATSDVPLKVPNYTYTAAEAKEKNGITLALVKPVYARSMQYFNCKMFQNFSDKMGNDYEAMMTARGYSLRGPFISADDMVYDDKENCLIYLQPEISIDMDFSNALCHSHRHYDYFTKQTSYTYTFDGTIVLSGNINMIFAEPFSKEKIKTLSISLPQKTVNFTGSRFYDTDNLYVAIQWGQDPGIMNPLVEALEDYYQSCFKTAYNHLDPQEVKMYMADAQKARDRRK